jgi:hypothetical protein
MQTYSSSQVLIGQRELVLRIVGSDGEMKEWKFRVTKMRCWKIMTLSPSQGKITEVVRNIFKCRNIFNLMMQIIFFLID